ncbi:uncharacterized protein BX664DRAFT_330030 [Halteromyces radiatus]|uniref:uncharacterized protein n=1 Tax=Halteromyces radiatus TaxID=101107 RepID=UPI00221EB44E|nr:uncharacterized protein BX664DRAFT_330030 [Halteromyces radiatus]KAI8093586.1 hypothetical protein BX664DRAFT_330030 [Halteromyces radiatus]
MGCCSSKEDHDEDDVRVPLLGNEVTNDNRMNYPPQENIDHKQEQEFWKDVVDRTTQNLIDISSSQTDPLQEQDIQERTDKYHDLLGQVDSAQTYGNNLKPYGNGIENNSSSSSSNNSGGQSLTSNMTGADISAIDTMISTARSNHTLSEEQQQWFDQAVLDIEQALKKIQVQPVGDMVVHLTMPDSTSISSY